MSAALTDDLFEPVALGGREAPATWDVLEKVQGAGLPLLIGGETGTGKSWLARHLHERLRRRRPATPPLVTVNVAALPPDLVAGELFGWEKGAHSTALGARKGAFQEAHGGTLFLDEVNRIPGDVQAKLLVALDPAHLGESSPQERGYRVRVLGGGGDVVVRCWLISASCQLDRLQPELLHRLRGVEVRLRPLRHRGRETRRLLALDALGRARQAQVLRQAELLGVPAPTRLPEPRLDDDAVDLLDAHDWPGNVRELEAVMGRAALLEVSPVTRDVLLWAGVRPGGPGAPLPTDETAALGVRVAALARASGHFHEATWTEALRRAAWEATADTPEPAARVRRTAALLGLSERTVRELLRRWRG